MAAARYRSEHTSLYRSFLLVFFWFSALQPLPVFAQFIDSFDDPANSGDSTPPGWTFATGDGQARMEMQQKDGYASVYIDATEDQRNIWWALVKVQPSGLDLPRLIKPEYELRVEAKIRVSHAPRRVNLHFNHQRTTDYHSHLMEYDIPDTVNWHTISMTTQDFEIQPGDQINAQMALMDWGNERYRIDIDYYKVDVVPRNAIDSDLGAKMPYHPAVADSNMFSDHLKVSQDAIIDSAYPDLNFNQWQVQGEPETSSLLSVNNTQAIILRWDMAALDGLVNGPGLLELTTHSIQRSPAYAKDFGMVRVVEILAGDPLWEQQSVTYQSFSQGKQMKQILNGQMVIDYPVAAGNGNKSLFTINQSVLQRLAEGTTLGLAILPLGAVHACFYAMESGDELAPRLHLNSQK